MTLLSACLSAVRSQFSRAIAWLPWLIVALLLTWLLWPEWTTPSQLLYQSPPVSPPQVTPPPPTNTPVPPPPADTPVPLPTDTPLLPTGTPVPSPTVEAPIEIPTPANTLTAEAPTPAIATATPTPGTLVPPPSVDTQQSAGTGTSVSVINWTKFWDTVMVAVAYPWLCCGIALLLLVPVGLIYLEIKGRRRPPKLPEPLRGKAGKEKPKEPNRPDA